MNAKPDTTAAAERAVGMSEANAPKNSGLRALAEKAEADNDNPCIFAATQSLATFNEAANPATVLALLDENERMRDSLEWIAATNFGPRFPVQTEIENSFGLSLCEIQRLARAALSPTQPEEVK